MTIRCHIIDDEPMACDLLKLYAGKLPELTLTAVSSDPLEAMETLKTQPADLLFLDIQMPEMTGLALLGVLANPPLVILTTAFSDFALESYDLDVVDYLKKPITFERFVKAVGKVEQRLLLPDAAGSGANPGAAGYIFVKEGTRFVKVMLDEIAYIEGLKNYVTIHAGQQKIVSLQRLKVLEEQLPGDKFIRVHNSYIVAKAAISSVKENEVWVGAVKIPIGETYFKAFMSFIEALHLR
ncbi:MAG TPA: LytTR family DNA-binding domain-containing protein [Puia sp.]|nr:LytTR family DNA-binding domain-containing protein [Puia sp.]